MSVSSSSLEPKPNEIVEHRRRPGYKALRLLLTFTVLAFVVVAAWKGVSDLRSQAEAQENKISQLIARIQTSTGDSSPVKPAPAGVSDRDTSIESLKEELVRLEESRLTAANIGWQQLFLAAVLYGLGIVSSAMFWHSCLTAFGQRPPVLITVAVHIMGQIGKYVPGKAMVIVIRATSLHRHAGVSRIPAVIGVFVETLTMMACGAAIAGIAVLFVPAPWWLRGLAVFLALGAAVPTLPPLFHGVLQRLSASRLGRNAIFQVDRYDWRLMLVGWSWMTLTWLMIGGSFWLITLATPGTSAQLWGASGFATAMATIALAMVAGFLSLIPGGAGVREVAITVLLAPVAGPGPALVAAVLARLIFLVVECATSGLSWFFLRMVPTLAHLNVSPTSQASSIPK